MNLLVIYAHPDANSLNAAIRDAFFEGAKEAGHHVDLIDLYAEHFDPVLPTTEKNGDNSAAVKKHQQLICCADWLVFIHPVWWLKAPAILEGWFDRVFTAGFAFRYKRVLGKIGIPIGLLPCKKAVVLDTYGGPGFGIWGFTLNVGWRRVKNGVLKLCGIRIIRHFPLYSADSISAERRKRWLEKVRSIPSKLR